MYDVSMQGHENMALNIALTDTIFVLSASKCGWG